jgi:hypothetical protein
MATSAGNLAPILQSYSPQLSHYTDLAAVLTTMLHFTPYRSPLSRAAVLTGTVDITAPTHVCLSDYCCHRLLLLVTITRSDW